MAKISKEKLDKFCRSLGADLFGVADIKEAKKDFTFISSLDKFNRAICLGVRIQMAVLNDIQNQPTKIYFHHYRNLNMFLDQMALRLSNFLQSSGFLAMPIPASLIVDWKNQNAHLSHKKIGILAGLGWIGRNNLLVNKKFGSQFRLVTVLTNADLKTDKPAKEDCAICFACLTTCPAGAIKKEPKDFDHAKCFEKLKEFQRQHVVEQYICGICVKACGGQMKPRLMEQGDISL
jgi:epoxyqueuosine reductase QueG